MLLETSKKLFGYIRLSLFCQFFRNGGGLIDLNTPPPTPSSHFPHQGRLSPHLAFQFQTTNFNCKGVANVFVEEGILLS